MGRRFQKKTFCFSLISVRHTGHSWTSGAQCEQQEMWLHGTNNTSFGLCMQMSHGFDPWRSSSDAVDIFGVPPPCAGSGLFGTKASIAIFGHITVLQSPPTLVRQKTSPASVEAATYHEKSLLQRTAWIGPTAGGASFAASLRHQHAQDHFEYSPW